MFLKKYLQVYPAVVFFLVTLFGIKAFSDEIKMIDGTFIGGEVLKISEESLDLQQKDGSIRAIQINTISLIARDNEIIIVNHENTRKRFSVLKIKKPEGLSIKDIDINTTDTLASSETGTETITVAVKESEQVQTSSGDEQSAHKEESPSSTQEAEVKSSPQQSSNTSGEKLAQSEEKKVPPPQKTWKGNADAGINIKDGNTESTTTYLKGAYVNERNRDNIYFNAISLYETQKDRDTDEDEETVNEQRATGKYEYKHTPRLYSFFNQYFEHDELEDLNYRSISSPGAGYRFIDEERLKYKAETGPAYTYERFHGGITDDFWGIRFGHYLDWIFLQDTKLYAKQEYVQSVENQEDWRLDSGVGVRHNLTKSIALSFEILNQYDNTPLEGNQKDDTTMIGSVGYNF
ncbi:MAG: DUF481 domain-containing protein [Candidatus Brocadia sp.]|nr:DUF481 domain-containing protein [Candidatus Brocadia sp.]